ncbi:hypothetical protein FRC03_005358 [Tulasnella sp. 419]|nr:hypothetical protein FRC03_005358 [Tulasnella sp. 419]
MLQSRVPTLSKQIKITSPQITGILRRYNHTAAPREHAIAFIGLGAMGSQMANNLFSKHIAVASSDQSPAFVVCDGLQKVAIAFATELRERFPRAQIDVVDTPYDATTRASTIVTMLPSSPQVNQVYLGSGGILPAILSLRNSSTLAIDSTTLDITTAKDVSAQMTKAGALMVDAPVSGGVVGAAAGTLSFMVGGSPEAFEKAKPYLEKMGKNIVHCGDSGTGLAVKICNNLILGINQVAVAEAMLLGTSLGLEPSLLAGVINNSTGRCWPSSVNNPVQGALPGQSPPCERDFQGGFASKLMLKDLNLALNAAKSVGVPVPLGKSSVEVYDDVTKIPERANKDFSVVYQYLKDQVRKE